MRELDDGRERAREGVTWGPPKRKNKGTLLDLTVDTGT